MKNRADFYPVHPVHPVLYKADECGKTWEPMSNRTRKHLVVALMATAILAVPVSWLLGFSLFSLEIYGSGSSPEGGVALRHYIVHCHWPLLLVSLAGLSGFALFLSRRREDTCA